MAQMTVAMAITASTPMTIRDLTRARVIWQLRWQTWASE
jgi:hypothetical protein